MIEGQIKEWHWGFRRKWSRIDGVRNVALDLGYKWLRADVGRFEVLGMNGQRLNYPEKSLEI